VRVLLSAFACQPDRGSEPEVGYQALRAAGSSHDVWVLTQPHMVDSIRADVAAHPLRGRVQVIPVEPSAPPQAGSGLSGWVNLHRLQDRWQRNAAVVARRLDADIDFDVVHHVTLAAHWLRVGVAELDKPLVWGPVGGAVAAPLPLVRELGPSGMVEDAVRMAVRNTAIRLPHARRARRQSVVTFAQNTATARALAGTRGVKVLSNGTSVDLTNVHRGARRGRDVYIVSRLIPWKAVPLGVRAFASCGTPDVTLRVFGDGPQREAVTSAARRYGVSDRVELVGAVARSHLLRELSTAGVLLHPSLHEEAGAVVAEACSLGTPVVCLDHGGPAELTKQWPQVPSVRVRPRTPARTAVALAAGIDEMLAAAPPVPPEPLLPRQSFHAEILAAYQRAAARS
jgi:glycosyltransferase involved in cell wall biosynthesis